MGLFIVCVYIYIYIYIKLMCVCVYIYIYIFLKSFYTNKMRMKKPKNVKYIRYKVRRTEGKGIVSRNQGTEECGEK